MRRLLPALVVLALPASASAHGGSIVASGSDDAYDVTVQIADITQDGEPAADVTVYPISSSSGSIDLEATTTVSIDGETYETEVSGEAHEVIVPVEETGGWRDWQVGARVVGDPGETTVGDFPEEPAAEDPTETTGATGSPGGVTAPPPAGDEAEPTTPADDAADTEPAAGDDGDDDDVPGWLIPVSIVLLAAAVALVVQRRRAMRGDNPVT